MSAPGRKLDEAAAFHVLEWSPRDGRWYAEGSDSPRELPRFSTDIAAAWLLVDKICEEGFRLQLDGGKLWLARFYKSAAHSLETRAFSVTRREAAAAICEAALAVKGVDLARAGSD